MIKGGRRSDEAVRELDGERVRFDESLTQMFNRLQPKKSKD